jgi:acid phosphatase (class A)
MRTLSCFGVALALVAAPLLRAGEPQFSGVDPIALLPPPPAANSAEQAADLAETYAVFSSRTPEERAAFEAESNFTIFTFAPAIGPWFQAGKFPQTEALFRVVDKEAKRAYDVGKDYWRRPRPYTVDPRFTHVKPEKSFSYPSGHSTRGTVEALVLAELFPDKRDAILQIGRGIGWHRVVGGVHYPSDVYAGRVLGQALAEAILRDPAFQARLAAAKAELAGAQ